MTAKDAMRQKALRQFAQAVRALPISVHDRSFLLHRALLAVDEELFCQAQDAYKKRHSFEFLEDIWKSERAPQRRAYRRLLRVCGVDSRHV